MFEVVGITVPFCPPVLDVLSADLFRSTTYNAKKVIDSASSTISSSMKVTRTFEGRRVSGSSNKLNEMLPIFR